MKSHLRGLADEFGESTNAIRLELNHLSNAGLLESCMVGNKRVFNANPRHPLFDDIRSLVLKHSGITQIIENVLERIGNIYEVWLKGDFAEGKDSREIDILILCWDIDSEYLDVLIKKVEQLIKRTINYMLVSPTQRQNFLSKDKKVFLIWGKK